MARPFFHHPSHEQLTDHCGTLMHVIIIVDAPCSRLLVCACESIANSCRQLLARSPSHIDICSHYSAGHSNFSHCALSRRNGPTGNRHPFPTPRRRAPKNFRARFARRAATRQAQFQHSFRTSRPARADPHFLTNPVSQPPFPRQPFSTPLNQRAGPSRNLPPQPPGHPPGHFAFRA